MYDKPKHQNLPYNLKCKYLKIYMIMFVLMLDSFENSCKKNNKILLFIYIYEKRKDK